MIAILDYKAGNQTSVRRALDYLGIPCVVTQDPETIDAANGVIFPGVGAAGQAMHQLQSSGLDKTLEQIVKKGTPLLGICLGCQILLESSEEDGGTRTLGLVPGCCRRFDPALKDGDGTPIRIPHMGWNTLIDRRESPLFAGIPENASFYFVHSYYASVPEELCLARCRYGLDFCAVFGRDGLWAVQFHPEKSGRQGLALLTNFTAYCTKRDRAC